MKRIAVVAAALLAAGRVSAQSLDLGFLDSVRDELSQAKHRAAETRGGGGPIPAIPAEMNAVNAALDAMARPISGYAAGPAVANVLTAPNVSIAFADQPEAVRIETRFVTPVNYRAASMRHLVSLRRDLAQATKRLLAVHLADAALRIRDRSTPDSAEREHMRLSHMGRVWFELGGDKNFTGLDADTTKALSVWLNGCGLMDVMRFSGKPLLYTFIMVNDDKPKPDPAEARRLRQIRAAYEVDAEHEWRWFGENSKLVL